MTELIDLPEELLAIIASSLSKRDLTQLISSCRQLSQSSSLLAHLWKEISLESHFPYHRHNMNGTYRSHLEVCVSAGMLNQYAGFVQSLSLSGPFPAEYYQMAFPRLHKLCFYHDLMYSSPDGKAEDDAMLTEQQVNNAELVRRNPNIKELCIDVGYARPSSDFWDAIYSTLQDPLRLQLVYVHGFKGADVVDSFWRACTLFEEIECKGHEMDVSELLPTLSFPRLKRLVFQSAALRHESFYPFQHLVLFKQCPNLTKLQWGLNYANFPVEAWAQAMERKTWPDLEDLSLKELINVDDEDLAVMFAHLPPLRCFTLEIFEFGQQAFFALQNRLFASIQVLNMSRTYEFTSPMAVKTLELCVHLEDFRAVMINAEDLCDPWICQGLKNLEVFFVTETESSNHIAFQRLSEMLRLEVCYFSLNSSLSVKSTMDIVVPEAAYPLQWKLGLGLERLVLLKRLRLIAFEDAEQMGMGVDELIWLKENLPALEQVEGMFSKDGLKSEELKRFAEDLWL